MRVFLGAVAVMASLTGATAQNRVVDAHPYGYVPVTVPATVRIVTNRFELNDLKYGVDIDLRHGIDIDLLDPREGFDIYITPNLVPEAEALSRAAYHSAAYCQTAFGSDRVKLTGRARHSELNLESWAFRAHCRR